MVSTQHLPLGAFTLMAVFVFGAFLAAFANYCVDRLAWNPRYRSPWSRFPKELGKKGTLPKRLWLDYIPIIGWFLLSRLTSAARSTSKPHERKKYKDGCLKEAGTSYAWISGLENKTFWIRPMLVELFFAVLILWRFMFWFSVDLQPLGSTLQWAGWGTEVLLFWICLSASLIDLDDYVIPDALMIPGICLGLALAALNPLLVMMRAPVAWPLDFAGSESTSCFCFFVANLIKGAGIEATLENIRFCSFMLLASAWTFWAFAMLDRRFYLRLGMRRASILFLRRLRRSPLTSRVGIVWAVGLIGLFFVTQRYAFIETMEKLPFLNPLDALAVSFIGLLSGMLLIWAVRLIGGCALGVEAMGFGDVVLGGMLGVFVGWGGTIVLFFIAPFFGLLFGIVRRGFNSERQIPYGPFLCLGALVFTIKREFFMQIMQPYIADPLFLLGIGAVGFFLLGVMLLALRFVKSLRNN